jgi:hypothetical protein
MAEAVGTISISQVWSDGYMLHALGTVAVGADPLTYATGGIIMSLVNSQIKAQRLPQKVEIKGRAGYDFVYVPGATLALGKLKVHTTAVTELAAAAVPAALSGDVIQFEAIFVGQN